MILSGQELETTVIHSLRSVTEEVDNMQKQVNNIGREMEILKNLYSKDI